MTFGFATTGDEIVEAFKDQVTGKRCKNPDPQQFVPTKELIFFKS